MPSVSKKAEEFSLEDIDAALSLSFDSSHELRVWGSVTALVYMQTMWYVCPIMLLCPGTLNVHYFRRRMTLKVLGLNLVWFLFCRALASLCCVRKEDWGLHSGLLPIPWCAVLRNVYIRWGQYLAHSQYNRNVKENRCSETKNIWYHGPYTRLPSGPVILRNKSIHCIKYFSYKV